MNTKLSRFIVPSALAASLGIVTSVASAQIVVKDSIDFNLKLEMDTVPTPVSGSFQPGGWTSDGDILAVDNSLGGNAAMGWTSQLSAPTGYTVEFRFQIVQGNEPALTAPLKYTVQLQAVDASGTSALNVIQIGDSGTTGLGLYSQFGNLSTPITNGWHTVRMAEEANSNEMRVWFDTTEITGFDWEPGSHSVVNRAWLGDLGGNVTDGTFNIDYFRVDNTGAFAPVPEPSSIALVMGLAVGGFLMLRRRRR